MTNTNTNNDILGIFKNEVHQNDILENLTFESEEIESNDILFELTQELQERNHQHSQENTGDILSMISQEDIWPIIWNIPVEIKNISENIPEKIKESKTSILISNIVFFFKYIGTSSLIFAILIVATNYSAYIEIARSYLNPEALEQSKQAMLTSVQDTKIIKNTPEEEDTQTIEVIKEERETQSSTEKMEMVKNKTYHSMDKLVNSGNNHLNIKIEMVPYENRIVIPKIGKNIPLVDVQNKTVQNVKELEDIFMKELVNGIVRYPGSARPGEIGNSFIFGHSSNFPWLEWKYNDVFALMDHLVFGDEIIAYYWQKKYVYKIKEKKVIRPGDTSVLKRNNNVSEITLMTCWPVGTTLNRMVVVWELVKE